MAVWTCKIGECDPRDLPADADDLMRRAIEEAYRSLTGRDPDFIFSGWARSFTVSSPPRALLAKDGTETGGTD